MSAPGQGSVAIVGVVALLALAVVTVSLSWLRARRRAARLLGPNRPSLRPRVVEDGFVLLGLAAIGLAWIAPPIGSQLIPVQESNLDLIVLLDVSRSMDARDNPPSRLARAQRLARSVLEGLERGDRVALAAFAGRGVLLTPLTPDREALIEMLPGLTSDLLRPQGSQLQEGVAAALGALGQPPSRPTVLLILSDGENPLGHRMTVPSELVRSGVRVIAVAFGSEMGAPIPDQGVPLRDAAGQVVVSRRELSRLEELARATGGRLFVSDEWGEISLAALRSEIRSRITTTSGGPPFQRTLPVRRVAPFAAAAFLLLWIESSGLLRRGRLTRIGGNANHVRTLALSAGALLMGSSLLGVSGASSSGETASEPRPSEGAVSLDPRAQVALGVARARAGDGEEARRFLTLAALRAHDADLAALAYFDLGVVELEQGQLEAARDAFLDALSLAPDDLQARFNLEWTLEAIRARPPSRSPRSSEPEPPPSGRKASEAEAALRARKEAAARAKHSRGSGSEGRPGAERAPQRQLTAQEVDRWLAIVHDNPAAGWRSLKRSGAPSRKRTRAPAW